MAATRKTKTDPAPSSAPNALVAANAPMIDEESKKQVLTLRTDALAFKVDCGEMYELACEQLRAVSTMKKTFETKRLDITRKFDELKKSVMSLFRESVTDPLDEAEAHLRSEITSWVDSENRRIAQERAEAERAAREERERLEAEAERQRVEAERLERERQAAIDAGDKRKAARIETKIEVAVERAETATINAEIAATAPVQVAERASVAGVSVRETWFGEVTNADELWKAAQNDTTLRSLFVVDEAKLNALAKMIKTGATYPGLRFFTRTGIAARRT